MNRPEGQPGWPPQTGHPDDRTGQQRQGSETGQPRGPGWADGQYGGYGSQSETKGPWQGPPGRPWGGPGQPPSPVSELETRVTGRRVIQYIIDYLITGIVASVILWALDRGHGAGNAGLLVIGAIVDAAWYFWYWVYRPYRAGGQSFGMQLLGLRVISKDGGRASMMQLLIRAVLLIVDTFLWGLVGLITIVSSRYRQRVGDHAARTLVIGALAALACTLECRHFCPNGASCRGGGAGCRGGGVGCPSCGAGWPRRLRPGLVHRRAGGRCRHPGPAQPARGLAHASVPPPVVPSGPGRPDSSVPGSTAPTGHPIWPVAAAA